jgi:hypothetical protein
MPGGSRAKGVKRSVVKKIKSVTSLFQNNKEKNTEPEASTTRVSRHRSKQRSLSKLPPTPPVAEEEDDEQQEEEGEDLQERTMMTRAMWN